MLLFPFKLALIPDHAASFLAALRSVLPVVSVGNTFMLATDPHPQPHHDEWKK